MVQLEGIKNIIFDFGGVLVDLKPQACLDAFAALGIPQVADYLTPYGHKGPFGQVENGDIDIAEFRDEIRRLFDVSVSDKDIDDAWSAFLVHTPRNKMRMVHELNKKYRVFLLSNTNPIHIRKLDEFDEAGYPIKECFEKLYYSYEIGLSKPGKAIFKYVLRDAGIKPEETLLVDDSPENCKVAAELGFRTFQPKPFEDFSNELIKPEPCVATLGFFDGVHKGHRFLIEETKRMAEGKGLPSMVVSFWPHPRMVLHSNFYPQLLTDSTEKEDLLINTGVTYVRTLHFDTNLASLSARQFMDEVLKKELSVSCLVIGFDNHFGNNPTDGFEDYQRYGKELGVEVLQANPFFYSEVNRTTKSKKESEGSEHLTVSSSLIRRYLLAGKLDEANAALGYNYNLKGVVVSGHQIGQKLGFPTANISMGDSYKLIPAFGVYAVWVYVDGKRFKGMMNIGRRPTLRAETECSLEVNLLNFSGNLYGKEIRVEFIKRFRQEQTFPDVDALAAQLSKDRDYVDKLLTIR